MAKGERKLDQFLSIVVLLLYVVVITIQWILIYQPVPVQALDAVRYIRTIIQCLAICVVLYNALGWTDNWIFKIIFIILALFLVASSIATQLPVVQDYMIQWKIPMIF